MKNIIFLSCFFLIFNLLSAQQKTEKLLNQNWEFAEQSTDKWNPAHVPGLVHSDLFRLKKIPDPWFGCNEKELQWIENKNWIYRCSFEIAASELVQQHIDLIFEGLDTYAEVFLNGEKILFADNMFRSWRVEVRNILKSGPNYLEIHFKNPLEVNKNKVDSLGYELPAGCETATLKVSPFTRKAAYHFGWDWGPRFLTCGIWKPVKLEFWNETRIEDIHIVQKSLDSSKAVLSVHTSLFSNSYDSFTLMINEERHQVRMNGRDSVLVFDYEIKSPKLWWPNTWGEPTLYPIKVILIDNENIIDQSEKKVGLRTVELIQEIDSIGQSFYFKVNGIPFFAKGANYIPQSNFLPSVSKEQYESLILDAKTANMNMLRVWGGGIYENDIFYDLCDEHGILVWQDFMFAGSMYPGDKAFVENVRQEVRENIIRLRNHPCIALWNGNNEMDVAWFNWGWQKSFGWSAADSAKIRQDYEKIFHQLIPDQIRELDSDRFYTASSPLSNWGKPENFNRGSMHYWGVWHGQDNFEDYHKNVGRFMAEYGFQSFPSNNTILKFADSTDLNLNSDVMKWHQKSYVGNGLILKHIKRYFSEPLDFADLIDKSQQTQALAMQMAIDAHRLKKGHCWGTLFWQLNDCWPGPSWSARDVYGNHKKILKELPVLFAPIALIPKVKGENLEFFLVSDKPNIQNVKVIISNKHKILFEKKIKTNNESAVLVHELTDKKLKKIKELKLVLVISDKVIFERKWINDSNRY
jgi:beta-mannosidase